MRQLRLSRSLCVRPGNRAVRVANSRHPGDDAAVVETDYELGAHLDGAVDALDDADDVGSLAARDGGPSAVLPDMCRALARRGHEVHVFTTNVDGDGVSDVPLDCPVEMDGVRVHYFASQLRRLYYSSAMRQQLRRSPKQEFDEQLCVPSEALEYLDTFKGVAEPAR